MWIKTWRMKLLIWFATNTKTVWEGSEKREWRNKVFCSRFNLHSCHQQFCRAFAQRQRRVDGSNTSFKCTLNVWRANRNETSFCEAIFFSGPVALCASLLKWNERTFKQGRVKYCCECWTFAVECRRHKLISNAFFPYSCRPRFPLHDCVSSDHVRGLFITLPRSSRAHIPSLGEKAQNESVLHKI